MFKNRINNTTKIMVVISYIVMVAVNAMATLLPLNGKATDVISDSYPNFFAPAGITFVIWGVIYFLLLMFVLYFLGFFNVERNKMNTELFNRIGIIFTVTSLANAAWLFSWHWEKFLISIVIMLVMLISLMMIVMTLKQEDLNTREKIFVKIPFSVYFGWITVATIANITTYLVSINWMGLGISEVMWTIIILIVGMVIGLMTILINEDKSYGLVMIWAYSGILIKHFSTDGFGSQYPTIMITIILSLIIFVLAEAYLLSKKKRNYNQIGR